MFTLLLIAITLLAVAMLYGSVGHGGASGYLAVFALAGLAPETIRPTALVLNVLVSTIALMRFAGSGHFRWSVLWPFALTAVPCAFLAGWQWSLEAHLYRVMLGLILLFVAWQLIARRHAGPEQTRPIPLQIALPIGVVIGITSGLIGIGGGIFLSPLLILCGWATAKQTAAASAAFVLLSSLAGLAGLWLQFNGLLVEWRDMGYFAAAVILGGFIGSTYGASRFRPIVLRRTLALVLCVAALKMLLPA